VLFGFACIATVTVEIPSIAAAAAVNFTKRRLLGLNTATDRNDIETGERG
jgi:hypothetical protein